MSSFTENDLRLRRDTFEELLLERRIAATRKHGDPAQYAFPPASTAWAAWRLAISIGGMRRDTGGEEMPKKKVQAVAWLDEPEEHDYPAAYDYLTLHMDREHSEAAVAVLRSPRSATVRKAKDIFRASGLPLLGVSNLHVERNMDKVAAGRPLSPVLLVSVGGRLLIADGYHRVCAVYRIDEDAEVPCRIVYATIYH